MVLDFVASVVAPRRAALPYETAVPGCIYIYLQLYLRIFTCTYMCVDLCSCSRSSLLVIRLGTWYVYGRCAIRFGAVWICLTEQRQ